MIKWLLSAGQFSRLIFIWLTLASATVGGGAENSKVTYPPVAEWVHEIHWQTETNWPADPKSAGTRWLVYESQERPKKFEEFTRVVKLLENENGVQDAGSLRLDFDAEFQELQVHRVAVHRAGKTFNRLNAAKVKIIQQEDELGDHMFTGRQTAVLFIEDLRVGDVLEYAYTVRGANPALGGHYSSRFTLESDSVVERELFRVVWDDKIPLQQRLHRTEAQPVITPRGDGLEYVWSFTNPPVIPYEDHQPASYEPYAYVEVSDFADWRSVVEWALPLYEASATNLPAELNELVAQWQLSGKSNEERARFALEFVQDKLRYTGIELGPDSYRPANPVETFEKRFGDCKGKVVLLRLLLRQMGIESFPALVNSSVREAIAQRLPSPFAFNHVILQMELDGKTVWVDPTYSHQGGSLWNRYLPPYGQALVIRQGNTALENVPRSSAEAARQQKVTTDFAIKNYGQPVDFKVRTEYSGVSADDMRDEIASTPASDEAKNYLNYYAKLYSGISSTQPLKFTDDRTANRLVVEEAYAITNLWTRDDADKLWKASFYADNLYNILTDPKTRLRKTPLALAFPLTRQQRLTVHLPDSDWQISESRTNIEHAAFVFNYHRQLHGQTLTFDYECRTKLAVIPAEMAPDYLVNLDRMENLLDDLLQRPDEKADSGGTNWLMVFIAIFGAGTTAVAGVWYWRRAKFAAPTVPPLIEAPELQGLGGWLILVGFGLCLGPIIRIVTLSSGWESYFSQSVWQSVAMPQGDAYHPFYAPLLILEMLGNIGLFGVNILALALFFTKRRVFQKLFIAMLITNALFLILDDVGVALVFSKRATSEAANHKDAIRAVWAALIWCPYMVKSRRVKATFTK